jgi:hypothetical protein
MSYLSAKRVSIGVTYGLHKLPTNYLEVISFIFKGYLSYHGHWPIYSLPMVYLYMGFLGYIGVI